MTTWCEFNDMPTDVCGCPHHHASTGIVISQAAIESLTGTPHPELRPRQRATTWAAPQPSAEGCTHTADNTLCPACDDELQALLDDLPEILEQLSIAFRKGAIFPPRGWRLEDDENPDEAPLPWNDAAAGCWRELRDLTTHPYWRDPANRTALHARLTITTARAHRIIDRPIDRAYAGPCPQCRAPLHAERGHDVTCNNTDCDYRATWDDNQARQLDAQRNGLLPMRDLLTVLRQAGHPITENRVEYFVKHRGLPRERGIIPTWAGQTIVTREVWLYRVDDVLHLQYELDRAG